MKSQGDYLRGMLERRSVAQFARVTEKLPSGDYNVTLERFGGIVAASYGNATVELPEGQRVLIMRVDASGAASNTGYIIISTSNITGRNSSDSSLLSTSVNVSAETLLFIEKPSGTPVTSIAIVHGGSAITFYARGDFLETAAIYGDSHIIDNAAQVITPTLITLNVKAQSGCPVGLYSLTVAGITVPRFFAVS